MKAYEVDYSANVEVAGTLPINADDLDQAEKFARDTIKADYPDYFDVQIEMFREINGK